MPYRAQNDVLSGTGNLVTVRQYLDPVQAQLARTRLEAHGIEAHVFDAASYNPMLSGAIGGSRLQVREGDLTRAEALVREHPGESGGDDGGGDGEAQGAIRCPRCELTYCFHERIRLEGQSAATALAFLAAPILMFVPKRWHCHKCGHVWTDPREGPAEMTRLEVDDPRPVFRLRRTQAGMGAFIGLIAGTFVMMVTPAVMPRDLRGMGMFLFIATGVVGWVIGSMRRYDLCSLPLCRTRLPADRETCPRCNGAIAGAVRSAEDHYSAAADFRRELRALVAKDAARGGSTPQPKKKRRPVPPPA